MSESQMQRRDKIIPWYFVMFFAFIALVDGLMVTLAVRTHTGTIIDHPYERGLAYNEVISAQEQQHKLGWNGSIAYENGVLNFALRDQHNQPIALESAVATFSRPTQAGMDFEVPLNRGVAAVKFPLRGQWQVRVNAAAHGQQYQQSARIVVP